MKNTAKLFLLLACSAIVFIVAADKLSCKRELTDSEKELYRKYRLDFTMFFSDSGTGKDSYIDKLLESATPLDEFNLGENTVRTFASEEIAKKFPLVQEITEISLINKLLYIEYISEEDDVVTYCIDSYGVNHILVYNRQKDKLIYVSDEESYTVTNFRYGIQIKQEDKF